MLVERLFDRAANGAFHHFEWETELKVDVETFVTYGYAAADALAAQLEIIALPFGDDTVFRPQRVGDVVDTTFDFLGAERVVACNVHVLVILVIRDGTSIPPEVAFAAAASRKHGI